MCTVGCSVVDLLLIDENFPSHVESVLIIMKYLIILAYMQSFPNIENVRYVTHGCY